MTKEAMFGMYIGQKCYLPNKEKETIIGVFRFSLEWVVDVVNFGYKYKLNDCKLILRPFESMTDEEKNKAVNMIGADHIREIDSLLKYYDGTQDDIIIKMYCAYMPDIIEYLISIGIDVFNLKDRGWAVYESDLEGENNETN